METRSKYELSRFVGLSVPPSGGSLEIGNGFTHRTNDPTVTVPPSGGSLEIGNFPLISHIYINCLNVPPSGGSLEIGNMSGPHHTGTAR